MYLYIRYIWYRISDNVFICFYVRALTYSGWCGSIIVSWSVLRGEITYSFDAHTDALSHVMLFCYVLILLVLLLFLILCIFLDLECLHSYLWCGAQGLPTIDIFISSELFDMHNPRCQYPM